MQTSLTKLSNNFHLVEFITDIKKPSLKFYYSYQTCIAVENEGEQFICINAWSTTTGKHLNQINPNKAIRLSLSDFKKKLESLKI